jgi:hypothetical protein
VPNYQDVSSTSHPASLAWRAALEFITLDDKRLVMTSAYSAKYVKPFLKVHRNDYRDAEAIAVLRIAVGARQQSCQA